MSLRPEDTIFYMVMTKRTLEIIKEFRDSGYQYEHIYIDHHPTYFKIYTSHATLEDLSHTLIFPTSCNPSYFRFPLFMHDSITITKKSDNSSQDVDPYFCTCNDNTPLHQPDK